MSFQPMSMIITIINFLVLALIIYGIYSLVSKLNSSRKKLEQQINAIEEKLNTILDKLDK